MRRASALLALPLCLTFALPGLAQQTPSCGITASAEGFSNRVPEVSVRSPRGNAPDAGNLLTFMSQVDLTTLGDTRSSDCWGYTAPSGREYAIICLRSSTAWIEISDPNDPVVIASYGGVSSTWRDAKVYQDHAYVVSDSGGGIQIFDMSAIDAGTVTQLTSVTTPGTLNTHNIAINEDSGFLYRTGGGGEGLRVYDLNQSLTAPPFVGSWSASSVHDAQIVSYTSGPLAGKEVAFCMTGNNLSVVNVTNKAAMEVVDTLTYPQLQFAHQGWLDEARQYFYINDERDEINLGVFTTTYIADVSDPTNLVYVGKFDNGKTSTGHNGYVHGDLLFESNNASGISVFDLSVDPLNPPEVGSYDTYPADDFPGFNGLWSVFPYFDSGLVIGSDRSEGLFVWYVGTPLAISLAVPPPSLMQVTGQVLPVTILASPPGNLVPGSESLHYNEGLGWQSLPLMSLGGSSYEAQFPALTCGGSVDYYFSAQSSNGFQWTDPVLGASGPYSGLVGTSLALSFDDDFELDMGWFPENLNASAGDFERAVPINDPLWTVAPAADADGSGKCWVTDNSLGSSDVDAGTVRLVSPPLDLTAPNSVIQYDYWCYLSDGSGLDFLRVRADDGTGSGYKTIADYTDASVSEWRREYITADDLAAAGVGMTSSVTLRFIARDSLPNTTVEAGLDAFKVLSLSCAAAQNYCSAGTTASGCQATLASSGMPSLSQGSGFDLVVSGGEGSKDGLFFFSQNGRQANSWGNGTSFQCVIPPVQRTPVIVGVGTAGNCDGTWSIDLNAWMAANPSKAPAVGPLTQLQFWFRDPQNTSNQTTSLSDATEFSVAP